MQEINSLASLSAAIKELESKRDQEKHVMLAHLHQTSESFKLINIIKSTFKVSSGMPDLPQRIMTSAAGISAGYIAQVIFAGLKNDSLRKLISTVFVCGISILVAQKPNLVKSAVNRFSSFIKILQVLRFRKSKSVNPH